MDLVEPKRLSPAALIAGAIVVLFLAAIGYALLRSSQRSIPTQVKLPFGSTEQFYARNIRFSNFQMSRAANFLNQQITYLSGDVENGGTRLIRDMEVTVEYRDAFHQVILRDSQRALGSPKPQPLPPGQTQAFQLTFDHVPDLWNHELPSVRVTGLALE